jgi:molybdenum cofactor cytidylyltransferase
MNAAAIVLCAGAGVRLGGRCKATLRTPDGRTFIDAIARAARDAGCADVVAVVGPPHEVEARAAAEAAGARVVANAAPERGMASSLAVGLAAVGRADVALLWPVDHACVRSDTVARVLAAARADGIVVPRFGGRGGHPTAFGAAVWPEIMPELSDGARAVVRRDPARVVRVDVDDAGVVRDVDAPEDLCR